MKPTQKPTLFYMHPLPSFRSSPSQRPAPFRTRTGHFLLDRLQLTSLAFHHPSFPQSQIVGALCFRVKNVHQQQGGWNKSGGGSRNPQVLPSDNLFRELQRERRPDSPEVPCLPCPGTCFDSCGPSLAAPRGHGCFCAQAPGSRFSGQALLPTCSLGAQPGWCVRTFNCVLSLAPSKRGENLIPFTTNAREAQRAKSLVLGTQHSWDCNSGDLAVGKGACLGSLESLPATPSSTSGTCPSTASGNKLLVASVARRDPEGAPGEEGGGIGPRQEPANFRAFGLPGEADADTSVSRRQVPSSPAGQTPPRRPPARSLRAAGPASPQLRGLSSPAAQRGRLPWRAARLPEPRAGDCATGRPGGGGGERRRAPPSGAQGAGVRAHAVRGGRAPGEPPTSPRRPDGRSLDAAAPAELGRTRAGDTRRKPGTAAAAGWPR